MKAPSLQSFCLTRKLRYDVLFVNAAHDEAPWWLPAKIHFLLLSLCHPEPRVIENPQYILQLPPLLPFRESVRLLEDDLHICVNETARGRLSRHHSDPVLRAFRAKGKVLPGQHTGEIRKRVLQLFCSVFQIIKVACFGFQSQRDTLPQDHWPHNEAFSWENV